ncbi:type II CAAX prenyl endopeptidase Rce1 family protein [Brevibacillus borstelensis]|uniref:CPBP family glutamic-type intramembrane protease n=1 Tax=Brevibacillus borstelensis TaxID=45462 RepID=UPI0030FCD654
MGGYFFHSHVFHREKLQSLLIEWNFSGDHLIWLILILLSVNPFLEELYWRGYIFHRLANTYKQHTAYSIQRFSLRHRFTPCITSCPSFLCLPGRITCLWSFRYLRRA